MLMFGLHLAQYVMHVNKDKLLAMLNVMRAVELRAN